MKALVRPWFVLAALAVLIATAMATTATGSSSAPTTKKFIVTVKLKPGIKWSDGTPLTARDFVGEYQVLWAQQDPIWHSLDNVAAPNDTTLVFTTHELSPNILRLLIRWNQTAARSQFGSSFDKLAQLRASGLKPDSRQVAAALKDLTDLKPDKTVAYGPYVVDPQSVTAQQLTMNKNPSGYNATKIKFSKIITYWGSTQQTVPLILSGQLDYTTDALTPTDQRAVAGKKNIELIRAPLSTGTGIWFNEKLKPFNKKEFRQAVAFTIDRKRNALVALGSAAKPIHYMVGFSDNLVPSWLNSSVRRHLTSYNRNAGKAAALLNKIGIHKGKDGKWHTASGAKISFEITAPTDFPDFLASAKDVSAQLNDFGFETKVRGIPAASRPDTIKQGRYQAMLDFSLVSTPSHPETSLDWNMAAGFFGTNNPEAKGGASKGLDWPWRQRVNGKRIYVPDLLKTAVVGLDKGPQKKAVTLLAQLFNDQLPVVPIFERYTTDPIAHGPRVAGWRPASNPVYQNNQGSDNYVSIQLLSGTLKPLPGADGTFRTAAPYSQPPDFSWNFYAGNSLYYSFTSPTYDLAFPPLFWYSEASKKYVPAVASSYSIRKS